MPIGVLFFAAAVLSLVGLCVLALPDVPRITGTAAFIVTLAALAAALLH